MQGRKNRRTPATLLTAGILLIEIHVGAKGIHVGAEILASAETLLTVGAHAQYHTISDAVNVANGDPNPAHHYVVVVAPGIYMNDFPHVTRPLTIEADPTYLGQKVLLKATVEIPNKKGIILSEANLIIDGLTFEGAAIPNSLGGNAAGIRDQNTNASASLTVRNSTFIGNQAGILTSGNPSQTISISNSTFKNNGNPSITNGPLCCQHAIYVSQAATLTVSNNIFCGQFIGHDIKSRAAFNSISRNILYVGAPSEAPGCVTGSASFAIDLPNGGIGHISNNQLIQGAATGNDSLLALGEEGLVNEHSNIVLSYDTFISVDVVNATAVYNPHCVPIELVSNTFSGIRTVMKPARCATK